MQGNFKPETLKWLFVNEPESRPFLARMIPQAKFCLMWHRDQLEPTIALSKSQLSSLGIPMSMYHTFATLVGTYKGAHIPLGPIRYQEQLLTVLNNTRNDIRYDIWFGPAIDLDVIVAVCTGSRTRYSRWSDGNYKGRVSGLLYLGEIGAIRIIISG